MWYSWVRSQLLSVDELSGLIPIENILISITKTNLETGLMTRSQREQFLQNSNQFDANSFGSGIIFIIGGLSFAVIWSEKAYYLFDSHGRDINRLQSPVGTSVPLKFGSVYEVLEYIREIHFIEAGNFSQYYQIQYLQAASPPVEVWNFILEALVRKRQRAISIANKAQSVLSTQVTKREQSQKHQQKRQRNLSEFEKSNIRHKNIVFLKSKRKKKQLQNLKTSSAAGQTGSCLGNTSTCPYYAF